MSGRRRRRPLVIRDQRVAIGLGIAALAAAAWSFVQAWERRGRERPQVARWLAV